MAAMRSLTPARRNLNVLSRYDDSVARIESLTLNDVTDMRASRGFDSSWQILHKDSTLQVRHFSCYFVPVALSLRIAAPSPLFPLSGGGSGATTHRLPLYEMEFASLSPAFAGAGYLIAFTSNALCV